MKVGDYYGHYHEPKEVRSNFATRCQFHQHFTGTFYYFAQLFSSYCLALNFFGSSILAQKLRVKCWWNWLQKTFQLKWTMSKNLSIFSYPYFFLWPIFIVGRKFLVWGNSTRNPVKANSRAVPALSISLSLSPTHSLTHSLSHSHSLTLHSLTLTHFEPAGYLNVLTLIAPSPIKSWPPRRSAPTTSNRDDREFFCLKTLGKGKLNIFLNANLTLTLRWF